MQQTSQQPGPLAPGLRTPGLRPAMTRAGVEIALIAALYIGYCVSRTLASTAFAPARGRAFDIHQGDFSVDEESIEHGARLLAMTAVVAGAVPIG